MRRHARLLLAVIILAPAACITVVQSADIALIRPDTVSAARVVTSPMKAFLLDGSTVVYPEGARVRPDSIIGAGVRYSLDLGDSTTVQTVGLDSVAGIEAFQTKVQPAGSVIATLGATALGVVGAAALAVAIFGSCPTFYTSAEQGTTLQSEAFSYSIAPLLEARDLDALRLRPDRDGVIRLELRNEALETHYINHLELIEVDHPEGSTVIPDDRGLTVALRDDRSPRSAFDRSGRDVLTELAAEDDLFFHSTDDRIRSATGGDPDDSIELTFDRPQGSQGILRLRLRNSLLNTILFYDMMLGEAGAEAMDWIGRDMAHIGSVVELGRWVQDAMGLRVEYHDGVDWQEAGRIPDTGPIAWEDVGVRIPIGEDEQVRVRLRFLTDGWRIDRAALGSAEEVVNQQRLPVSRLLHEGQPVDRSVLAKLALPDDEYLATYPATSARLEFDPSPASTHGVARSYLLSTQGYYTEWVRPDWIRGAERPTRFQPGDGTVEDLMSRWLDTKEAFEADFYEYKVPVR